MQKDIWLEIPNERPRLRVRITYHYSEVQRFTAMEETWSNSL